MLWGWIVLAVAVQMLPTGFRRRYLKRSWFEGPVKCFRRVSDGFPTGFRRVSDGFPAGFRWPAGFRRASDGFPDGFPTRFPPGFWWVCDGFLAFDRFLSGSDDLQNLSKPDQNPLRSHETLQLHEMELPRLLKFPGQNYPGVGIISHRFQRYKLRQHSKQFGRPWQKSRIKLYIPSQPAIEPILFFQYVIIVIAFADMLILFVALSSLLLLHMIP